MALEKTFRQLSVNLYRLRDRFKELRLAVVVDRPKTRDAVVVDNFEYAVEDILGWIEEALQSAGEAEKAVAHPPDLGRARQALTICQERYQRVEQCFSTNLVSYDRVRDLTAFGHERRGEWPSWVTSVKQGIEHCRQPMDEVSKTIVDGWQEIAERVGMTQISVRTTNIGQKIVTSEVPTDDWLKQGAT